MENSRERLIKALNHEQPERIPLDMGSTPVSGISAAALFDLRKALKLKDRPVKVHEPFQILGLVEEDVMQALEIDIAGLWGRINFFGFENKDWKPWRLQNGIEVLIGSGFTVVKNAFKF